MDCEAQDDGVVMRLGVNMMTTVMNTEDLGEDQIDDQRNMGGRPKGSTKANKQKMALQWKQAINWVVARYSEEKEKAQAANKTSNKPILRGVG